MVGHRIKLDSGSWEGAVRCIPVFNSKVDVGSIQREPNNEADVFGQGMNVINKFVSDLNTKNYGASKIGNPIPDPPVEPPIPNEPGQPTDRGKWKQAQDDIRAIDKAQVDLRINARYDDLGGGRT